MVGVTSRGYLRTLHGLLEHGTSGQISDAELLERFTRRENAEFVFEALVARHGPAVLQVCRSVLGQTHDAEDAFQATFLVLARRAHSIARPEELGAWLRGVARRIALKAKVADLEDEALAETARRAAAEQDYLDPARPGEPPVSSKLEALMLNSYEYEKAEKRYAEILTRYLRTTLELNTAIGERIMP
jgi:DNA-directed RNA polymerase specialized sigma24 family protein